MAKTGTFSDIDPGSQALSLHFSRKEGHESDCAVPTAAFSGGPKALRLATQQNHPWYRRGLDGWANGLSGHNALRSYRQIAETFDCIPFLVEVFSSLR
jgi:hypothetical protein